MLNTLREFKPGRGYLIYVTQDVTLHLKGPVGAPLPTVAHSSSSPEAPTTYYGMVQSASDFAPTSGVAVNVWIEGVLCGKGRTMEIDGAIFYSVQVDVTQCRIQDDTLSFQVGTRFMRTTSKLVNRRSQELTLVP